MKRSDLQPKRAIVMLPGSLAPLPAVKRGIVLRPQHVERITRADKRAADKQRAQGERIAAPRTYVNAAMCEPMPPSRWCVARDGAEDFLTAPSLRFGQRVYRGSRGAGAV